jgi:hypothetical protein
MLLVMFAVYRTIPALVLHYFLSKKNISSLLADTREKAPLSSAYDIEGKRNAKLLAQSRPPFSNGAQVHIT